jgi:hypothetical protein
MIRNDTAADDNDNNKLSVSFRIRLLFYYCCYSSIAFQYYSLQMYSIIIIIIMSYIRYCQLIWKPNHSL